MPYPHSTEYPFPHLQSLLRIHDIPKPIRTLSDQCLRSCVSWHVVRCFLTGLAGYQEWRHTPPWELRVYITTPSVILWPRVCCVQWPWDVVKHLCSTCGHCGFCDASSTFQYGLALYHWAHHAEVCEFFFPSPMLMRSKQKCLRVFIRNQFFVRWLRMGFMKCVNAQWNTFHFVKTLPYSWYSIFRSKLMCIHQYNNFNKSSFDINCLKCFRYLITRDD